MLHCYCPLYDTPYMYVLIFYLFTSRPTKKTSSIGITSVVYRKKNCSRLLWNIRIYSVNILSIRTCRHMNFFVDYQMDINRKKLHNNHSGISRSVSLVCFSPNPHKVLRRMEMRSITRSAGKCDKFKTRSYPNLILRLGSTVLHVIFDFRMVGW